MRLLSVIAVLFVGSVSSALEPPAYLTARDENYKWEERKVEELGGTQVAILRLTSQKWQGSKWRHWMHVIRPEKVTHAGQALLVISGGNNSKKVPHARTLEVALLQKVAEDTGSVIVVVGQVPNQPLFDDLYEDGLIAHSFQKFLDTGDESWPALLPMTISAMRAMDAAQEYALKTWDQKIEKFVVTGASKRGWTTWMTGGFDTRVSAIAPMVIDTLNMPRQMRLQVESFGSYSEKINDYTKLNLQERMKEASGQRLLQLVDPYSWRERMTMPKLIVLGTNDPYWPVDALKMYYADLPGETYIHYVPNAGHGLGAGAVEVTAAFYQSILAGEKRPKFGWKMSMEEGEAVLTIAAEDKPSVVEIWSAESADRDFRKDTWSPTVVEGKGGTWICRVKQPAEGFTAFHARLTYKSSLGHEYGLCTNNEVLGPPKK